MQYQGSMDTISLCEGVAVGIIACALYQGLLIFQYWESNGSFPWDTPNKRAWIFFLAIVFKLLIAGFIVWLFIKQNQINGLMGAAMIGIVSDEIMMKMYAGGRKEYANGQA
jgi:hypothetical protein